MSDTPMKETEVDWRICRHELPPYGARVLLSYKSTNSNWRGVTIGKRGKTDAEGEHWQEDDGKWLQDNIKILAWAPLPKATREE